jgi:hypothetical protein
MTTGQGIFGGLTLIAAAIAFGGLAVNSHAASSGPWTLSAGTDSAWKMDTTTGAVEICQNRGTFFACHPVTETPK